jgi:predicted DsbA family dithiol-disulfide isomerase
MKIDIWSDVVCPWCYLGKRRIDDALAHFGGEHEVVYHAFELNPGAPRTYDDGLTNTERIGRKIRASPADVEAMQARMTRMGAEAGVEFRFDRVQSGNTFDAHRIAALGLARGAQAAVVERLMKGCFTDGEAIGDRDVLVRLAGEAGLDVAEARDMLAGERFTDEVRADEERAKELRITGVPFFMLGGKIAVAGAQSVEALVQALTAAAAR